ncbi:MAG TPA: GNAT family N-acetyltransferase [Intrasporangium sp.]|uniref:GNAT family N-acetyltransferase n=1 Tax=Intrasporangium sp. TaxID=1925024 RepID=UPI002D789142|nr:GNAT family N-acetyltransferase [Intrasporangium sp.]HET7398942.1 GNAT family N-acetyltransferase [Intrasporangium sp.]
MASEGGGAEAPVVVRDDRAQSRYEVYAGDDLAGFLQYELGSGRIALVHTEVKPAYGGRGLAARVVTEALDDARARALAVLPFCPYVRRFLSTHRDYVDLVPEPRRKAFGL